jgi:acetyl esterase/lipase
MRILIIFISVFLAINDSNAQKSIYTNLNNIDYRHNIPPSLKSKIIKSIMGLIGMKKKIEKKIITNSFVKYPAKLPRSVSINYNVREIQQNKRKVWTISPVDNNSDVVILYLHGGAYMANISKQHWSLIAKLIKKTGATVVVPDYPLAPEATYKETYSYIAELYRSLTTDHSTKRIILMGDSAGGGLALGFVQQIRNRNIKQPEQIIMFSPWLDVSMTNPNIELLDKKDKILSISGLKNAGKKYAGNLDLKDSRISPISGDLTGMGRISIFTGTKDILNADAQKCRQLMNDQNILFNYYEYPEMFHDWVIITSLKESCDVIEKVDKLINNIE